MTDIVPIPPPFLTGYRELVWSIANADERIGEFQRLEKEAFPHRVTIRTKNIRISLAVWIRDNLEHAWMVTTPEVKEDISMFEYRFQSLSDATMFKLRFG